MHAIDDQVLDDVLTGKYVNGQATDSYRALEILRPLRFRRAPRRRAEIDRHGCDDGDGEDRRDNHQAQAGVVESFPDARSIQ